MKLVAKYFLSILFFALTSLQAKPITLIFDQEIQDKSPLSLAIRLNSSCVYPFKVIKESFSSRITFDSENAESLYIQLYDLTNLPGDYEHNAWGTIGLNLAASDTYSVSLKLPNLRDCSCPFLEFTPIINFLD